MKKMISFLGMMLAGWFFCSGVSWGGTYNYGANEVTYNNAVGIGVVTIGNTAEAVATWHPDVSMGYFSLGLDVNILLSNQRKTDLETVVLRHIAYEAPDYGARYGILSGVTFGYGLLMDNYTTRFQGSSILTNRQGGGKVYYYFNRNSDVRYGVNAMATWSSLYAARVTEQVHPMVIFGQNVVTDVDGVTLKDASGVEQKFPAHSGYSLDVGFPIRPEFVPYVEYAHLDNGGGGLGAGVKSSFGNPSLAAFDLKVEYRSFDKKFVPGFFNSGYETNPVNLSSVEATAEATSGFLAGAGLTLLDGRASAGATLQSYGGKGGAALSANAQAVLTDEYSVAAWYDQPSFTSARSLSFENGAVYTASLSYKPKSMGGLVITSYYKRYYDSGQQKVVDTTYSEISFSF